jgi:hypothetical protein
MKLIESINRPGKKAFLQFWGLVIAATWVLMWLLFMIFEYPRLQASMVPYQIFMLVSVVPIAGVTLAVQVVLFLTGRKYWPDDFNKRKRLMFIGTPLISWFCIWLGLALVGGVNYFLVII